MSRDQQHRILPLVLTRASSRQAYATARFASVVSALFILCCSCLVLLYAGEIGLAVDPSARFAEMGTRIFPAIGLAGLISLSIGGMGAGVAVWSPRRAFATASIIALVLLLTAVSNGLDALAGVASRNAELLSPIQSTLTLTMQLFGESNRGFETNPPLSEWTYVAGLLGFAAFGLVLLQLRLRRLET